MRLVCYVDDDAVVIHALLRLSETRLCTYQAVLPLSHVRSIFATHHTRIGRDPEKPPLLLKPMFPDLPAWIRELHTFGYLADDGRTETFVFGVFRNNNDSFDPALSFACVIIPISLFLYSSIPLRCYIRILEFGQA